MNLRIDPARYETYHWPDMALWVTLSPGDMALADAEADRVVDYWDKRKGVPQLYEQVAGDNGKSRRHEVVNRRMASRAEVAFARTIGGEWTAGKAQSTGSVDVTGPPPESIRFEVRHSTKHSFDLTIHDGDFRKKMDQVAVLVTGRGDRYAIRGYMPIREARERPEYAKWRGFNSYGDGLWIPQDDIYRFKDMALT